jgi:transposase
MLSTQHEENPMPPLIISSREDLEHQLVTLYAQGLNIRALSRHFCLGRNTVRRILRKHKARREYGQDTKGSPLPRASKLDPYLPRIRALLDEFPDITGERLFEEMRAEGYMGGISILRDRLRSMRSHPNKEPVVRFETDPGVQGQMDWSPYTIRFLKGGKATVLCFSYILAFSRRQYIDFTLHRDFHTLIRRHRDAFGFFGGVPRHCLYDGEKTVVLRFEAGRPVFNPAFIAFITHYECQPIAVRRARTKGKVERPFQFVEGNLLNGRKFQDLEHLRAMAGWWMKEKSDRHRHETTGQVVIELFLEQEKDALRPLPVYPYDCSEVAHRVCRVDGFIEFETNLYSVPYQYVADILVLKATEQEVSFYSPDLELIACHERLPTGASKMVENPEHRLHPKTRYGLEPVRESFLALGQASEDFLKGLQQKHPRNCGFHARFILRLKEHYASDDINSALRHATVYHAYDGRAIERILKAKAKPRTLEAIRNDRARTALTQSLPVIRQRDLEDYCTFLSQNGEHHGPDHSPDQKAPESPQALDHGKDP